MQRIFSLIIIALLAFVFMYSCSGSPSIKVKGKCLADSHCENGYYCNDSYKCQKMPGFDGDADVSENEGETAEDTDSGEEGETEL